MIAYALDLLGVFAFASYGAYRALCVRMNLFGVFICGALVAMGGGTVRELILHGTPRYLVDYWYVAVVAVAVVNTVVIFRHFDRVDGVLEVLDAVGLGAFALFGAMRATEAGFGLGGMILGGVLTAVGGGVICDVLTGRLPQLFLDDVSIVPVLLTTVTAWLLRGHLHSPGVLSVLVTVATVVRLITLRLGWKPWRPRRHLPLAEQPTVRMQRSDLFPDGNPLRTNGHVLPPTSTTRPRTPPRVRSGTRPSLTAASRPAAFRPAPLRRGTHPTGH